MNEEILIVDDNADIRNIINELIIDAGYKTRLAANYNQALAEIDKKLPDVAILDVKLDKGDNDGIELLSHIKSKNKDTFSYDKGSKSKETTKSPQYYTESGRKHKDSHSKQSKSKDLEHNAPGQKTTKIPSSLTKDFEKS